MDQSSAPESVQQTQTQLQVREVCIIPWENKKDDRKIDDEKNCSFGTVSAKGCIPNAVYMHN